jgi:hypothetical protein
LAPFKPPKKILTVSAAGGNKKREGQSMVFGHARPAGNGFTSEGISSGYYDDDPQRLDEK